MLTATLLMMGICAAFFVFDAATRLVESFKN